MPKGLPSFLLGFAFGVLTLAAFRHELHLTGHVEIMVIFAVYGAVLVVADLLWYRRVRRRVAQIRGEGKARLEAEWTTFVWGSLFLFVAYFGLMLMVIEF
jgi:hypothetical protein